MGRNLTIVMVSILSVLLIDGISLRAWADSPSQAPAEPKDPQELARRFQEISEVVLQHHVDPPARQQMILAGIKGLYEAAGLPTPFGLSRRVSTLTTPEQFSALLAAIWPVKPAKSLRTGDLEEAFVNGMLATIPGGAVLVPAKEHEVQEQFQGNRYIGIHIQVSYEEKEKRTIVAGVLPGGPADRARMMQNDRIEQIDGVDTKDMSTREVVDRLRGADGTDVSVTVRQPKQTARTLKMTRGPLFIATVTGVYKKSSGEWNYCLGGADPVSYIRIRDISASTPHELRKVAQELQGANLRGVIIDLRGLSTNRLHPTVMVADCLLDHGRIGQVREAERVMTYDASPGAHALFRGWPMVVLIDGETAAAAEWLAAALQDSRRAILVGSPTRSGLAHPRSLAPLPATADVESTFPVGNGAWYLTLVTGRLERGDGRPLGTSPAPLHTPFSMPRRLAGGNEPETEAGVKPDYRVGPPHARSAGQTPSRRPGMSRPEDSAVDPWTDRAVAKAIELLRAGTSSF